MCFFFLELDTEYRYWWFMEALPTHNSLLVKAKMEVMDALTWVIMAFIFSLAPLCSPFHFIFYRASPSLPSYFVLFLPISECQDLMTLFRCFGVSTGHLFFFKYTYIYIRRQMIMMIKVSKHALFLGFSSELVSRLFT